MNLIEFERVTRENEKNKSRIKDQNTTIDCLKNDLQAQSQLVIRLKNQLGQAKQQIKSLNRQIQEQQMERERVESRYLTVLQGLQSELQECKKRYSKLQNKIVPLMDQDSVRLKILNQVQSNHQLEIGKIKSTVQNLRDEVLRYKRQNQILKHLLENERMSRQQQMRRARGNKNSEYAHDTINYLTSSMWKDLQAKLKNSYEQARKEAEFYKQKYFAVQKKYQAKMLALNKQDSDHYKLSRYQT